MIVSRQGFSSLIVGVLLGLAWTSYSLGQDYLIGPRDVLTVNVWGQADLSKDYPVDQEGFVQFPLVGLVKAAGLSARVFGDRLADLLGKDYLVNPQVSVFVKEYLSQKVQVLGEAGKPGLFYLAGPTTLLELLSRAEGLSRGAGKQLVLVRRQRVSGTANGNTILRVDVDRLQRGDVTENVLLQDQDLIFVPRAHAYFVLGEVKAAGTFPLDREVTAVEALTIAGGFNDRAAPSGVKLIRRLPDGQQETVSLDLSSEGSQDRNTKIQEGDTIFVPKGNTFFIFGEVQKPGAYQLEKETNVLEGITIAGGFTSKAAPGRARVIRKTSTGQQVFNVDVNELLKGGRREKAILLQENDVVVVPESFF